MYLAFVLVLGMVSAAVAPATRITPMWTDLVLMSYDTTNTCIYVAGNSVIKSSDCNNQDTMLLKEIVPSGYKFTGWFQLTFKTKSYGTLCIQAGSKTGYRNSANGDKVIAAPCAGSEPTQIWKNHDYWNGYFQYEDLGSGKCLCFDKKLRVPVMWDCNYYANNHWWQARSP